MLYTSSDVIRLINSSIAIRATQVDWKYLALAEEIIEEKNGSTAELSSASPYHPYGQGAQMDPHAFGASSVVTLILELELLEFSLISMG